jgi:hypothetical protein
MNGVGWGIGVFFVLIVFLPVYFVVRKPLPMERQAYGGAPVGPAQLCASCGKYSSPASRFCSICGQQLVPSFASQIPQK